MGAPRLGDDSAFPFRRVCAGGVGHRPVCGGQFTIAAGSAPIAWPNGTGSRGQPSVRGLTPASHTRLTPQGRLCTRWRFRAVTCMRGALSPVRGRSAPIPIAALDASAWSALGSGWTTPWLRWRFRAVTCMRRHFYHRGRGQRQPHRQMERSAWLPLGSGMGCSLCGSPLVKALVASGSDLYAGGLFSTAGSVNANSIAKWDGSAWSTSARGSTAWCMRSLCRKVTCMRAATSLLRCGGQREFHRQMGRERVVRPSASGVGGVGGEVYALAMSGSDLYAGGDFVTAGGGSANFVAQMERSAWSALGSGMSAPFNSAHVYAWRCRAPTCMRGAFSNTAGAARPTSSQMERERLGGAGMG